MQQINTPFNAVPVKHVHRTSPDHNTCIFPSISATLREQNLQRTSRLKRDTNQMLGIYRGTQLVYTLARDVQTRDKKNTSKLDNVLSVGRKGREGGARAKNSHQYLLLWGILYFVRQTHKKRRAVHVRAIDLYMRGYEIQRQK